MTDKKNAPIGVFDSGVGGLTVAREIMRNLPGERIVYFGDTARVPYGSKSKETVLRLQKVRRRNRYWFLPRRGRAVRKCKNKCSSRKRQSREAVRKAHP